MASNLRVDQITASTTGSVSIGTATFTGGLSGDITGLNVTGVITATTLNQNVSGILTAQNGIHVTGGSVGIGSDSPQTKLDIVGDVRILDNSPRLFFIDANANGASSATGGFEVYDKDGNKNVFCLADAPNADNLLFGVTGQEKLRITSDGNVGIGTDNPKAQTWRNGTALDVYGGAGNVVGNLHIGANRGDGVQTVGSIVFYDNTQDTNHKVISIIESDKTGSTTNQRGGTVSVYVKEDATVSSSAVESATFTKDGISFPSGKGIDFSAASGSAAGSSSALLDDYEEGTHETTAACSSGGTVTLSQPTLAYTKIGRLVTVHGRPIVSAVSSPTGTLSFSLPFAASDLTDSAGRSAGSIALRIVNSGYEVGLFNCYVIEGNSNLFVHYGNGSDTSAAAPAMRANTQIWMTITYVTSA
jgi:hypothetical protein